MSVALVFWICYIVLFCGWLVACFLMNGLDGFGLSHFVAPFLLTLICWQIGGWILLLQIAALPVRLLAFIFYSIQ